MVWETLVLGASTGVAWSVVGYLKNRNEKGDSFDLVKLGETAAIGAGLGAVIFALPIEAPSELQPLVVDAALTGGLLPYIKKLVDAVKGWFNK